jgi:hypothetical protein
VLTRDFETKAVLREILRWAMPEERADRPAALVFRFDGAVVAGR